MIQSTHVELTAVLRIVEGRIGVRILNQQGDSLLAEDEREGFRTSTLEARGKSYPLASLVHAFRTQETRVLQEVLTGDAQAKLGELLTRGLSPRHMVRLDGFAIARTETTVGQLRAWLAQGGTVEQPPSPETAANLPAVEVSWDEARAFCRHYGLDVPTEAQWEYAARAGTTSRFSFGNSDIDLGRYAWYGEDIAGNAHPVAGKLPNPLGMYDVHGNVWEWVADSYDSYPDGKSWKARANPTKSSRGRERVARGGSFWLGSWGLRSADRVEYWSGLRVRYVGFRCAVVVLRQP